VRQWGDRYACDKPSAPAGRARDRKALVAALVPKAAGTRPMSEAEFVAGPDRHPTAST